MDILIMMILVTWIVLSFLLYPIIDILKCDYYRGWEKVGALLLVLTTSWVGYLWLMLRRK